MRFFFSTSLFQSLIIKKIFQKLNILLIFKGTYSVSVDSFGVRPDHITVELYELKGPYCEYVVGGFFLDVGVGFSRRKLATVYIFLTLKRVHFIGFLQFEKGIYKKIVLRK